jgi:hypothetical protein
MMEVASLVVKMTVKMTQQSKQMRLISQRRKWKLEVA